MATMFGLDAANRASQWKPKGKSGGKYSQLDSLHNVTSVTTCNARNTFADAPEVWTGLKQANGGIKDNSE